MAGALVAVAMTLVLVMLGTGLGFASISPWANHGLGPRAFTVTAAIWLIVTQWVSSLFGGYITGRLRTRWIGTHEHEIFFRDTANGLVTWALATVAAAVLAGLLASAAASGIGSGAHMASGVAAATAHGAADGDSTASSAADSGLATDEARADEARKDGAEVAIYTALSMLIGAFIASAAAALGGRLRDEHL